MKIQRFIIPATMLAFSILASHAQPALYGGMSGPPPELTMSGSMKKIFGEHAAFSANVEIQSLSDGITMPGKMATLDGETRFETDMTQIKGGQMTPAANDVMKHMGTDLMIRISRPDKKLLYMIYPHLQAYVESALRDPDANAPESDFKAEVTEVGTETVDGHPCVKNKVVV